jgi:hypothetical protein
MVQVLAGIEAVGVVLLVLIAVVALARKVQRKPAPPAETLTRR